MAAMNGPQFVSCMLRQKNRLDFTSTLQDLRQWPTLGQSSDSEQKKKAALLGNSSSNSTGKAASSSRLTSNEPSSVKSASVSSATPSFSDHNPTDSSSSSHHSHDDGSPVGEDTLQKRNSVGGKKGGKKVWEKVPKEKFWPPSQMAMQDRMRRQESFGAGFRPNFDQRFRPQPQPVKTPVNPPPAVTRPPQTGTNAAQPTNTAAPTGQAVNSNSVANQPFRNNNANAQGDYNRRFRKPPPPPFNGNNRPRIARKLQGFSQRDMIYDGDYMGRDGDGQSDGADDVSQNDYNEYGYYNNSGVGFGTSTPDWSSPCVYYDYGVEDYSQGYLAADDYSGYGYYGGGVDESGLYIPPSPMPTYTMAPFDGAELKEMIKYQIEYYFSPSNLEKDFFLRRMMAKDGSVMLGLVASFRRVSALTQDFSLIIESIVDSQIVQVMDNFMIRPRQTPEAWPIEEEDDQSTGYYYLNGDMDDSRQISSTTFDETDESGTGEEVSYPDEDEEEEEVSMDGSVSSEHSEDVQLELLNLKTSDHSVQVISEQLLQQVM